MHWFLLSMFAARAEVLDRVVAVVGDQPVLASEVAISVELALLDPGSRLPPPRGDPTTWAIETVVVRSLAEDVKLYDPSPREVHERVDGLRATFADRESWGRFLARHGLDETRLEPMMRRQLVVERFLLRNVQADPDDRAAWNADAEALLAALRENAAPRMVPAAPTDAP
jgi:hypothetical protein